MRQGVLFAAWMGLAVVCAGCDGGGGSSADWTLDSLIKGLFGKTPSEHVAMAFDPNDADRRREGIIGLSKRDWGLEEPYLKGYATLLKTDGDPLVRAAAVRALGKAQDPNYVEDVARALFDKSDAVRHDAGVALDLLVGAAAAEPLRNRAINDTNQDVRASCAWALRHYRRDDVVRTLIECLSDRAFGVRHRAHASLVALVGQDHGFAPEDWAEVTLKGLPEPKGPEEKGSWWDRLWGRHKKPSGKPPTGPASRPAP